MATTDTTMRRRTGKETDLDDRIGAKSTDSRRMNVSSERWGSRKYTLPLLTGPSKPMHLVEVVILLATLFLVAASPFLIYGYGYLCASRNLVKSGDVATVRLFTVIDRDGRVVEPGKILLDVRNLVSS